MSDHVSPANPPDANANAINATIDGLADLVQRVAALVGTVSGKAATAALTQATVDLGGRIDAKADQSGLDTVAEGLQTEQTSRVNDVQTLSRQLANNTDALQKEILVLFSQVAEVLALANAATGGVSDAKSAASALVAAEAVQRAGAITAALAEVEADIRAASILLQAQMQRAAQRPGDNPLAFTLVAAPSGLRGAGTDLGALAADLVSIGDAGATALLRGPGVLGAREPVAIEDARVYRFRAVVQRRADPSDPAGDAVRLGVVWLDRFLSPIPGAAGVTLVETVDKLTVGIGRQERVATLALHGGAAGAFPAPALARYARPFVQVFGADGQTAVEVLALTDASEGLLLAPETASTVEEVAALVSLDAGPRLSSLESRTGSPSSVGYATKSDAQSADIPTTAQVVALLGSATAGDGMGGSFVRAQSAPAGSDSFTNKDGSIFVRVLTAESLVEQILHRFFDALPADPPDTPRAFFSAGGLLARTAS